MRRRRKATSPSDTLRRLAREERWDDVRTLLAARLARDPHDAEARAEMERLNQGLPLRATENALTRKRREEQEMLQELAAELALFCRNPHMLAEWPPDLLHRRLKRITAIHKRVGRRLEPGQEEEYASYLKALASRSKNHHARRRRCVLAATLLPLLLLTLGGTAAALRHRASEAEDELRKAYAARDLARVEHTLHLAQAGVNRYVSRSLSDLINRARGWQARTRRQEGMLRRELASLERNELSISALPLLRRAELEGILKALPADLKELRDRWQKLCDMDAQALAAQREEVRRRFNTPLPPQPKLTFSLAGDDEALEAHQRELQQLAREWEAALAIFSLEDNFTQPLQSRLASILQLRQDIAALRRCLALLPNARNYGQYQARISALSPKAYTPALRMAAIREHLPQEENLRSLMQEHGRKLPPGMLDAAQHALLNGGSSFTPAFPASSQQVQIMEDLFSYSGLQKVLYEMSAPTLPRFIVEERPEVSEESVSFSPSPLTPGYTLHTPRRITWLNPQGVFIRRIDCTPLLLETPIARDSFFATANLPALLDKLLRLEHAECPELARAFVFHRLLELMRVHEWPTMLGLAYAPTLRADIRSFSQLIRTLDVPLEPGCWLVSQEETQRAEAACARWFRERKHRHYAGEIARNFSDLVQVHPRYVGFMNESGRPVLFRQLPKGTLLWYLTEDGLTTSTQGELPEPPLPLSPVFIVAKD